MSVWGEIVVPIAIGPIFLIGKYVWDLFHDREQDILRRKYSKQMEMWERSLKEFYWPFYMALTENQQLWKYAMQHGLVQGNSICKGDETDSSDSEGEEDHTVTHRRLNEATVVPAFDTDRCAHYYTKSKRQCGVPISKHQKRLFGSYCMAHYILHRVEDETVVWRSNSLYQINDTPQETQETEIQIQTVYDLFEANHAKLMEILESHLPIISSRSHLGKYMIQFQQYISAFQLVNHVRDPKGIHNPKQQGAPYPKRLVVYVETKLLETQKQLYERTENFYAELDTKPPTHTRRSHPCRWCCVCGTEPTAPA